MCSEVKVLLIFNLVLGVVSQIPTVQTHMGTITGKENEDADLFDVDIFLGIPFAKPPIGELRFKKPEAIKKYVHPIKANKMPPSCPQMNLQSEVPPNFEEEMKEDCLYLNVWKPSSDSDDENASSKAVMVWMYGQGYSKIKKDLTYFSPYTGLVIVGINYRLGQTGFFTSGGEDEPGNLSYHDQILALQWIQENIHYFGGDPTKVTIFKGDDGLISSEFLIISPLGEGLFSRAILGNAAHATLFLDSRENINIELGNKFALKVGCATKDVNLYTAKKKVMDCLRKKDISEILKVENDVGTYGYRPVIGDEVLPYESLIKFYEGKGRKVDILIGYKENEGMITGMPDLPLNFELAKSFNQSAKGLTMAFFNKYFEKMVKNPEKITALFFKNVPEDDLIGIKEALFEAYDFSHSACPNLIFADYHAQNTESVYFYYIIKENNLLHKDEIIDPPSIKMFTSFAKGRAPLNNWPKYEQHSYLAYTLNLKEKILKKIPNAQLCKEIWLSKYEEYVTLFNEKKSESFLKEEL